MATVYEALRDSLVELIAKHLKNSDEKALKRHERVMKRLSDLEQKADFTIKQVNYAIGKIKGEETKELPTAAPTMENIQASANVRANDRRLKEQGKK